MTFINFGENGKDTNETIIFDIYNCCYNYKSVSAFLRLRENL